MAASTTDKFKKVGASTVTTLSAPGKALGATSINVGSTTNYPTDTGIVIAIRQVDSNGELVAGTYTEWLATVSSGTSFAINAVPVYGSDQIYSAGSTTQVLVPISSKAYNDLVDGVMVAHNQDGSLKTSAVQTALNVAASTPTGYTTLATVPTLTATNGNNSFNISFPSVDYTDRLSKGMKLLIPRTVTPQTQVTSLNGTTQYWSKTTPSGMTFTDDFCAGAWIYITAYGAAQQYIISRWNGTSGWGLRLETNGQITLFGTNAGGSNYSWVVSSRSVPLNKWVHVSAQLDMSTFTASTTTSYIMIDGVNVPATVSRGGTNPTALVQAGNLEIGSTNGGATPFAGKMAQAWVSSAKVTQANVQNFMYHGITASDISTNSIISAYSFAGNSSDLNTTNANNLTANGGVTATNADSPFNANCYAIITSDPTFSTNTTMTVQAANGYGIPNETLGTSSYTGLQAPLGFPRDPAKWTVTATSSNDRTTTGNTSWNSLTDTIVLPIGSWSVRFKSPMEVASPAATATYRGLATLSSDASTETDPQTTITVSVKPSAASVSASGNTGFSESTITTAASTTFTVMGKVTTSTATLGLYGSTTSPILIRAVCAYL